MDEATKQLQMFLDQLSYGDIAIDSTTHEILFCNAACLSLIGYGSEELISILKTTPEKVAFPDDLDNVRNALISFWDKGTKLSAECRIICKDGRLSYLRVDGSKLSWLGKTFILVSFGDVTAEKTATEQFDFIADNIKSSVCLFSIEENKQFTFLYGNEPFFTLIGTTRGYYVQHMDEINKYIVSPGDYVRISAGVQKALKENISVEVEHQVNCLDGRRLWVRRNISVKPRSAAGKYYFISIVDDITAQKEEAIRRELVAERQEMVIGELKAAVFEWNLKTCSYYCSDSYKEYALSQESLDSVLANKGSFDSIHPDDIETVKKFFTDTKSGKARAETEIRLRLVRGGYRWVRIVGLFFTDADGKPERTIGIIIDINRDKEEAAKMNSIINALPGGVAIYRIGSSIETLYSSDGIPKISGRTMEEYEAWLHGDILSNTVYIDDIPCVSATIAKAVAVGGQINVLYRLKHKNGSLVWVQLTADKIREENGASIYYAVYLQPSAETQLYQNIVDDSFVAIYVAEITTRRILYVNKAWRRLESVPPDRMVVGRSLFDVIPKSHMLFTLEQQKAFPKDSYEEKYVMHKSGAFLHLYVRSILWNGINAYILYASDETQEHSRKVELQELVDHVPGGIGIYTMKDHDVDRTYLNDGYFKLLGWKDTKFKDVASHIQDYVHVHPDDRAEVEREDETLFAGASSISVTYRALNAEGGYTWIRNIGSLVKSPSGSSLVYCSFTNVDMEKNAELQYRKQLDDSNQFDAENLLVKARYNLRTNQLEYGVVKNASASPAIYEKTYDAALALELSIVATDPMRKRVAEMFDRKRLMQECKAGHNQFSMEFPIRLATGRVRWTELNCKTFLEPFTADVINFLFITDITEQMFDRRISESLIETRYDQIVLVDLSAKEIIFKNLKEKTTRKEAWGTHVMQSVYNSLLKRYTINEEDRKQLQKLQDIESFRALLDKKDTYTFSLNLIGKNGSYHRKQVLCTWLGTLKEVILVTYVDVTEAYRKEKDRMVALQKAIEEAKLADQAKSDFLSRISHDMRTPLNGILGLTQLMRDETDIGKMRDDIVKLELSGNYLLNLVNDTLDVNKIEKGQMELHPEVCDGFSAWNNVSTLIKPNMEKKGLSFQMHVESITDRPLFIDVARLEQLFMNIVGNAIKFTPKGGRIDLYLDRLSSTDTVLQDRFIVKDTGIGMCKEFLPHVFEPFSQEHGSTTSRYEGTGLGMTISKKIVTLMGGTITVESTLGKGTTFTVIVPLPFATEEQIKASRKSVVVTDFSSLRGKRILVCEDNAINAEIVRRMLDKMDVLSDREENGKQGVEMFAASAPRYYNAILMDIRMPLVDGLAATVRIRKMKREDAKSVPIVAMTANALDEDVTMSLKAGMNAHLAKPFAAKELFGTLASLIDGKA